MTQNIDYSSIRTFLIKTVSPSNEQHCTVYVFEETILLFESHLNFGVHVIVRLKHRLVFFCPIAFGELLPIDWEKSITKIIIVFCALKSANYHHGYHLAQNYYHFKSY